MIYNFDFYKRYEKPTMTLCSPDDTEYGLITNAEDFNIGICFGNISDISYTIKYDPSPNANNEVYDKHIKRRQVHLAGIGYFIIDSVVEVEDDEERSKKIKAKSCESELNNIAMPYIEGTYQLYKAENFEGNVTGGDVVDREDEYLNENCILYEIMRVIPSWTLDCQSDFIDKEKYIELAEKYRTFDISESTVYSFLKNEIQDEYECFVDFDIDNRKIRIRTYDDVFDEIDAIISKSNILNSCEVTSTSENSANCLKVESAAGVSIGSCNPMGGNVIYNFDSDINSGLIDGVLRDALLYWKNKIGNIEERGAFIGDYIKCNRLHSIDTSKFDTWLNFSKNLSECKANLLDGIGKGDTTEAIKSLKELVSGFKYNYVKNGSFELNDSENETKVLHWTRESNTYGYETFMAKTGARVLRTDNTGCLAYQKIFLPKGKYTLEYYVSYNTRFTNTQNFGVKIGTGIDSANRCDGLYGAGVTTTDYNSITNETTGEKYHQKKYTKSFTVNSDNGEDLYVTIINNTAPWKYFDDISIVADNGTDYINPKVQEIINLINKLNEEDSDIKAITSKIENIFVEILFEKYRLLPTDIFNTIPVGTDTITLSELNRQKLYLNKLKNEVENYRDTSLNGYLEGYKAQLEALEKTVIEEGSGEEYENEKKALEDNKTAIISLISLVESEIEAYDELLIHINSALDSMNNLVVNICNSCDFTNVFNEYLRGQNISFITGEKLYANLIRFIKQQSYNDDTIIATSAMTFDEKFQQEVDLYNKSKDILKKASENGFEIKASAESFLFSSDFEELIRRLDIYSAIYVELPNGDVPLFHLLKISINYDDGECELTFGNKLRLSDPAEIFSDLQKTATTAASIVSAERIDWGTSKEKINELILQKNMDIDTTFRAMSNSINDTTMGSFGFKCFARDENGNPSHGIWAANGAMMFMDKDQKPRTAIGRIIRSDGTVEYGFYGESILAHSLTADKFAAGTFSKGTNYIKNGSFEGLLSTKNINNIDESTNGDGLLVGWKGYNSSSSSNSEFLLGNWEFMGSGRKIRIYKNNNVGGSIISTETIKLPAGKYTISYDLGSYVVHYSKLNKSIVGVRLCEESDGTSINIDASASNCSIYKEYEPKNGLQKRRFYKQFEISEAKELFVQIINNNNLYAYFDNIMIECSDFPNEYTPHISETYAKYTTIDERGVNIYNGKLNIFNNNGNAVLSTDNNGNLTLKGRIEASGGNIGGWSIGSDVYNGLGNALFSSQDNFTICLNPTNNIKCGKNNSSTIPAIYAGVVDYNQDSPFGNCDFFVSHGGYMKAAKGTIAGWTFGFDNDTNKRRIMYATANGKKYGIGMSTHNDYPAFWAGYGGSESGYDSPDTIKNKENTKFFVQHDGSLYAANATITGNITATGGEIGGWTITDTNTNKSISSKRTVSIGGKNVTTKLVFSPISEKIIDFTLDGTSNFYVHRTGFVAATDFRLIEGYIGGKDGGKSGWIVGENEISIGLGDGKKVGMSASVNNDYTSSAFYAGDSFWVTHGGKLNALGADISGVFTTTTTFDDGIYQLRVDGESLLFRRATNGDIQNQDFRSGILFASNANTDTVSNSILSKIFGSSSASTPDLAIAGENRIIFVTKSDQQSETGTNWAPVCELGFNNINLGNYSYATSLYFRPASVGIIQNARLGDAAHPWSEIYMLDESDWLSAAFGVLTNGSVGTRFYPQKIRYLGSDGNPEYAVVLASKANVPDRAAEVENAFKELWNNLLENVGDSIKEWIKSLLLGTENG